MGTKKRQGGNSGGWAGERVGSQAFRGPHVHLLLPAGVLFARGVPANNDAPVAIGRMAQHIPHVVLHLWQSRQEGRN